MNRNSIPMGLHLMLCMGVAVLVWGGIPRPAHAYDLQTKLNMVRETGVPDYSGAANWAYSPYLQKFVDDLPGLCNGKDGTNYPANKNAMGQCIPVGVPDTTTYDGSDYYELEIVQYREQMHSDLPELLDGASAPIISGPGDVPTAAEKMASTTTGGTLLRGYRQVNAPAGTPNVTINDLESPHNMGVVIVASKDRPVRIKFTNKLPIDTGGDLFIPTDTTVMGSGPGPTYTRDNPVTAASKTDDEVCKDLTTAGDCFSQNRATLHLHGGRTPWISDGTAHQWITPAGEFTGSDEPIYSKGVSVAYVPDMWYDSENGNHITACAGQTYCSSANATNNPGDGSQTYYWTNEQSSRLMFYHEHAWGITRLGVYVGAVAGYLVSDPMEDSLVAGGYIPPADRTIPLIIQDKTFVDASTIIDNPDTIEINDGSDPTWIWGSKPGTLLGGYDSTLAEPVTGDLWWPHVYVPAQDPFNPDLSGTNPYGRWHYGPWFWPPTEVPWGPIPNPYYASDDPIEPPEIPSTPNPSWGAEAFMDAPVINGTAYPKLDVAATTYRFRILNGAHDRFWNLQLYVADPNGALTEVDMVPAVPPGDASPDESWYAWPTDGREGGVPNPAQRGPAMVQIGTEGGFLPAPVVLPNRPVNWNVDPTTFTAGLVLQQNQGGGTLMLAPAERADVIVDFSQFAGKTLVLYNDAPAPWPALDPHYDYYTDSPDYSDIGGAPPHPDSPVGSPTIAGFGPNTRTLMQINVLQSGSDPPVYGGDTSPGPVNAVPANLSDLEDAFKPAPTGLGVFKNGQEPIIVGQSAYDEAYGMTFPSTWPNWGISRITDTSLSFMTPDGSTVTAYPMEPKAIQDEMGEVFDEFGRMSAKLGLELARTTAGIQTFVLQNFVDPPTEIVAKDQVQIWKITHNGVDTHPVHFHLFEVQVLNRVGWDGFIYLPDPNEIGWKDTVRISPLEDTIVALRPAQFTVPFTVPNSMRPLNPAYPLGGPAGFSNLDPATAQPLNPPVTNEIYNFGQEYLWHCHILSHEEQDMMRPIVLNDNSILYTLNTDGFWQWNRGEWSQITNINPSSMVASGTFAYADYGTNGLWQWNGYDWRMISDRDPIDMVASESGLYVTFTDNIGNNRPGLYKYNRNTWTKLTGNLPTSMAASETSLYANFSYGLYEWKGNTWTRLTGNLPTSMVASETSLYAKFTYGLYEWKGNTWTRLTGNLPTSMVASETSLYAKFTYGLYEWNGTKWARINGNLPSKIVASEFGLYADFSYGLYEWNGAKWTKISSDHPSSMDASGSILFANFGGVNGVKKWEYFSQQVTGSWSLLQNSTPVTTMEAGF